MANVNRLQLITDRGELVYRDVNQLNISLSRIVDSFKDIGNRFGDFSYTFSLPMVKENNIIFNQLESIHISTPSELIFDNINFSQAII